MHISIIILAAGSSSRMGRSKQLLDVGGKSLLRRTAEIALGSQADHVIVVVGSNAEAHIKDLKDTTVNIIENPAWANGMGTSIKSGVSHAIKTSSPDAVVVLVCDQPFLTSTHINKLIDAFTTSTKSIVASSYSGSVGVPVLIARQHFDALLTIEDDQGAKRIIREHDADATFIDFPEGAVDLDTPEDYNAFLSRS